MAVAHGRQVHHSKVWDPEFIHAINSPDDKQGQVDTHAHGIVDQNGQHLVAHNVNQKLR